MVQIVLLVLKITKDNNAVVEFYAYKCVSRTKSLKQFFFKDNLKNGLSTHNSYFQLFNTQCQAKFTNQVKLIRFDRK